MTQALQTGTITFLFTDLEGSTRLLGAAQMMRETININMHPAEQVEYEGEVVALKKTLDRATLGAAWLTGRQMDSAQAVACALGEVDCL